ncbi:MAG: acyl-CoA thioesterase [Bacteroidales bacterium]|nr:acyl-CoA thioesterase [Bacteroidales bacterium]
MKKNFDNEAALVCKTKVQVRFSDLDPMSVVWHGNYIKYFEDGRQAFGRQYKGLGYMDMYQNGYTAPLVELNIEYLKSLNYNDEVIIETRYIPCEAAKIIFEYHLYRASDNSLAARGRTVQAFINAETGELQLNSPLFYSQWKQQYI